MTETHIPYAVFYLLTYRLAVILLGGVSIYLGYRLFTQALGKGQEGTNSNAELSGRFNGMELTLKSAAPGTFFAAFGAAITISVLAGSPPKFDVAASSEKVAGIDSTNNSRLTVRTGEQKDQSPKEIFRAIRDKLNGALGQSKSLARSNPDIAEFKDLQAKLEFVNGEYRQALEVQKEALELKDNADYNRRLAAYRLMSEDEETSGQSIE